YVTSLYVQPDRHGAGLGSALLAAALHECEVLRVDTVILWPTPKSRPLYQRHGFVAGDDLLEWRLASPRPPELV
ncbi:MAG: GNAT family N-acetyltransferase, partial [Actinomycetota bacterium]